jgi:hypothetical protein
MAQLVTDLIDYRELTAYTRSFMTEVAESEFSLRRWFPNTTSEDLAYKIRTGTLNDVDVAVYRAWDTAPPHSPRQGFTEKQGELAPLGRTYAVSEEEQIRLKVLDTGNNAPLVNAIYNDVDRAMRSIAARLAQAQGDILVDGILTLAENGVQQTLDFGMPSGHKVTAGVAWTAANAATAVPITDLLAWQEVLDTDSEPADVLLLPRAKLNALQVNAQIRAYAAEGGTTPQRVTQSTITNIFLEQGLPRVEFYDEYVRINGVRTRILPANYAFMLPDPDTGLQIGETAHGPTAEAIDLIERGLIARQDAAGVIAVVTQNVTPLQTFTTGNATALPLLMDANSHIAANIG